MKYLVVLALTVAVASAAFTGSLIKQTQPLLDGIRSDFSRNIAVKSSADVGLRGAFLDAIAAHLGGILAEVESTIAGLHDAAENVAGIIQSAVGNIQTLVESLAGSAQEIAGSLIPSIQGALGNLLGSLFGGSRLNLDSIFSYLQELVASISLPETLRAVILQIFGESIGNHILNLLSLNHRGWFDNIIGGITDVWGSITGSLQDLADQIGDLASDTWASIQAKFNAVKEAVTDFVAGGWNFAVNIGWPAAQQLLVHIAPYYCQLGHLGATAVSSLLAAYTGLTIPPGIIVQAGLAIIPGDQNCP